MSKPNVTLLVNNSTNDIACSDPAGDSNFIVYATGDKLTWRSTQQSNGDLISGNAYPPVASASEGVEAPKTFLKDASTGLYKQIPLAGTINGGQSGGDTRYVFALYIDAATAGIPQLEAWNANTHLQANSVFLGGGNPTMSVLKAIKTTNGSPGIGGWAGTALSGLDSYVPLDTVALAAPKFLYFNMRMLIPSGFGSQADLNHVLTCRLLYS